MCKFFIFQGGRIIFPYCYCIQNNEDFGSSIINWMLLSACVCVGKRKMLMELSQLLTPATSMTYRL